MQHICQSELASNSEPASDPSDSGSDQDQKTHLTFLPLLSLLTSYLSHPSAEHRHLTSFLLLSCTASLVDGYNLPLRITNSVGCPVADCPVDLGPGCTCFFFFLRGGRAANLFFFCGGVDWGLTIELGRCIFRCLDSDVEKVDARPIRGHFHDSDMSLSLHKRPDFPIYISSSLPPTLCPPSPSPIRH